MAGEKLKVYMVHYRDRKGVDQRVRVTSVSEEGARTRVENREGAGCVEEVHEALASDKIQPC